MALDAHADGLGLRRSSSAVVVGLSIGRRRHGGDGSDSKHAGGKRSTAQAAQARGHIHVHFVEVLSRPPPTGLAVGLARDPSWALSALRPEHRSIRPVPRPEGHGSWFPRPALPRAGRLGVKADRTTVRRVPAGIRVPRGRDHTRNADLAGSLTAFALADVLRLRLWSGDGGSPSHG